ncbi:MAG: DUF6376 family protein [Eubacteriales bacterium]|nr:DUF6376 family protein [Eubacteriales bacterium]
MSKNVTKRLVAALLAGVMVLSLGACGKKDEGAPMDDAGQNAPAALTEEEYMQAVQDLSESMTKVQTDAANVDMTDPDASKQILEDLKQPLNDFIAINAPEAYAEAHDKMKSGCAAMVDYIDTISAIIGETDQQKIADATAKATESIQTAMQDLTEGATLMQDAAQ